MTDHYELYYWPFIPGRGEYVRLVFEAAGQEYVDVGRLPEDEGGGVAAIRALLAGDPDPPPFAPPILKHGGLTLAQTPAICHYLAGRLGTLPNDERGRQAALQHQLTIADLVSEAHETHHPLDVSRYYEDQKEAARERAEGFRERRIPKFLQHFERALRRRRFLLGDRMSACDLGLFQTIEGLDYAFPNALARHLAPLRGLMDLRARIRDHERVAAYLASDRRLPFNEHGIFRRYPELDP